MTRFSAPIAEQIWDMKYRFKDNEYNPGQPVDSDVTDTWNRIATALALAEGQNAASTSLQTHMQAKHQAEFYSALEDFKFLPAGRIIAGAGTGRAVTLFNCFVMGTIPDSMSGIFDMLKEAALTMQQGGGIGYDFSTIRPKGAKVKKLGADASGPISFMRVWDAMCRTVMSAGSRRGAMMATMRCDHPDILDFVTAKQDAAELRMFNLSVLVTDAFMEAVRQDKLWELVHSEPPAVSDDDLALAVDIDLEGNKTYVHKVVKARELWDQILRCTYDAAEPGVIFIDRINDENNLRYCEKISATNPCGEQALPPYGACLLGSINLARLVRHPYERHAGIDSDEIKTLVRRAVRMMDNVVDVSNFALPQQRDEAKAKRRIGLGVTGVADALVMCGLRYGSEEAADRLGTWMKLIDETAYWASVELAKEKGPFPLFSADALLEDGTHASKHPPELKAAIREHGLRNALLTSIAPTGTISLYAGNVSSGIEPIFAASYTRKVLQPDGTKTEERVVDYALQVWESLDMIGDLPPHWVTMEDLKPEDHVRMQAAAQEHVDNSISKTVNLPEDISFEDFKAVYDLAYDLGCKGCTTYRPNEITGSVLSVDKPKAELPWSDTAAFAVEVQDTYDKRLVPDLGRPDAFEHFKAVNADFGVDKAVEVPVERRQEYLDFLVSYEVEDDKPDYGIAERMLTEPEEIEVAANAHEWEPEAAMAFYSAPVSEELPKRPEELTGSTYKIKIGDQSAVYLTVNDLREEDGSMRPFEVFLRSSDPSHDEWMVALARTVSAVLRRPYDARFLAEELKQVHSHTTGGYGAGGYKPSLVAAIGSKLGEHMDELESPREIVVHGTMTRELAEAFNKGASANPRPVITPAAMSAPYGKPTGPSCPKCFSHNLKNESGCQTCLDCGHSKCG